MYGMINNYLKTLITKEYGEDVWTKITRKIKIEDDGFIEMMVYDDDLTYHIVQAAVDICSITAEDFLEKAGYGWVSHTNKGSYSTFYKMYTSMEGFLNSLNAIHEELSIVMEGIKPPQFFVSSDQKGFFLDYLSRREGLVPFVYGLLQGLAEHYEEDVSIEEVGAVEETGAFRFAIVKRHGTQ